MKSEPRFAVACLVAVSICAGCSGGNKKMLLELRGAVMYEKPQIESVGYTLTDLRSEGGVVVARITLSGDPGLTASFDITPDVIERQPMDERDEGVYVGEFRFPIDRVGGPFSVVGRLRHAAAGESVLRDPEPLIISLPSPRP